MAGADDALTRGSRRLRSVLGLATLVMTVLSWPLWVEHAPFPRVPFAPGLPALPRAAAWAVFPVLLRQQIVGAVLLLADA